MARPAKKKTTKTKAKTPKKPVKKTAKAPVKATKESAKVFKKVLKFIKSKAAKPVSKTTAKPSKKELSVGSPAPDFTMSATQIGNVSLAGLKGKPFVLYFYPKDDTSGCTAEACEFRNTLPAFTGLNAAIIGVSKDNIESHEKFSRKYSLNFPLASDETADVCERYGTWVQKSMYGRSYMGIERSTFLVDGKGIIRAIWRKVSVTGHVDEVKKALAAL